MRGDVHGHVCVEGRRAGSAAGRPQPAAVRVQHRPECADAEDARGGRDQPQDPRLPRGGRPHIPVNSIQNSVSETISINNLPNEDLILIVNGGGARKISADFDIQDNISNLIEPEYDIKVDKNNTNKVEIFEKSSGHSIATRILDQNRVFEFNGNTFQFSEQPLVDNSFSLSENKSVTGDARNILKIIDLQMENENQKDKGNFQEIFNITLAKVGSNVQANKLSLTAAQSNMEAAEGSQSEFAGVNLDEEAANLMEFQQAYQASARILQTARELFQTLIEVV